MSGGLLRLALTQLALVASGVATAAAPLACRIEAEQVVDVGAPVVGIVEAVRVDRGDAVKAGQPLVALLADAGCASLQVEATRAKLDADLRAAQADLDLAQQRLVRAEQLLAKNFISPRALDQARAAHEAATQKLKQAREQKAPAPTESAAAKTAAGLRTIRSPFNGIVVERLINPGERAEEKPILRLAKVDPLRVEVTMPAAAFGSIAAGGMLTVRPELPNALPVSARVTRIDQVIDAASNTFRVRLTLPNPGNVIPAGLRCQVDSPGSGQAAAGMGVNGPAESVDPPLILRRADTLAQR